MANPYFRFKQFTIYHDRCAMKVTTDSCVFGAWVAKEIVNGQGRIHNVLDIGSGSGLLSLMVAQKNEVKIDAVEIDAEAAEQSRNNVESSPWKERVHVFTEDITSFKPGTKYDCVISNPPFYENDLSSESGRKNTAHHSEHLTLSEVLGVIKRYLCDGGVFFLLLPFKRKEELERLLHSNALYVDTIIELSQSMKHGPFRILVKGSKRTVEGQNAIAMSVWDEEQEYSGVFIELLKDYYLYL